MTDVKDIMAAAGVFKGADSLPKFVNKQEFWDKQPYSNRLYFGDNADEYITRGHFQTAITALTHLSEQNAAKDKEIAELREALIDGLSLSDMSSLPPVRDVPVNRALEPIKHIGYGAIMNAAAYMWSEDLKAKSPKWAKGHHAVGATRSSWEKWGNRARQALSLSERET